MAAAVHSSGHRASDGLKRDTQGEEYSIFKDPRYRVLFSIIKGFRNGAV